MNSAAVLRANRQKLVIFALVTFLHLALLFFAAVRLEPAVRQSRPAVTLIRLVDAREEIPPAPAPPPESEAAPQQFQETAVPPAVTEAVPPAAENIAGSIAGHIMEADTEQPDNIPQGLITEAAAPESYPPAVHAVVGQHGGTARPAIRAPVFPEAQLRGALADNYPRMARLSNMEGTVKLKLFIDHEGNIREVRIINENPPHRRFGSAAVSALRGIRAEPATRDGAPIAVEYDYEIRFTLR